MPMYKQAQDYHNADDEQLLVVLPSEDTDNETVVSEYDEDDSDSNQDLEVQSEDMENDSEENNEHPHLEVLEDVLNQPHVVELSFSLPRLPGAEDEDLEVSEDDEEDVEEEKSKKDSKDDGKKSKDWQSLPKSEFLHWLRNYLDKIPKHKGETIALERAVSYLKRGLEILSKSVQQDFDGEIDISKADDARSEMEDGIERLEKELNKRRKKADTNHGMTKEGQKAMGVNSGGVMVTVPLIVSAIARACVNAVITNGKDLEDTFDKLAKKYKLTDREKMETIQLLKDMNMPFDRDLSLLDEKGYGYSSEDNINLAPNYHA